jgi:hypothetical protein
MADQLTQNRSRFVPLFPEVDSEILKLCEVQRNICQTWAQWQKDPATAMPDLGESYERLEIQQDQLCLILQREVRELLRLTQETQALPAETGE